MRCTAFVLFCLVAGSLCLWEESTSHPQRPQLAVNPEVPACGFVHNYTDGRFQYLTEPSTETPLEIALKYAASQHPGDHSSVLRELSNYKTSFNGITHVHLIQIIKGLKVLNAHINVNVDEAGRVISLGDSYYVGDVPSSPEPLLTPVEAVKHLVTHLKMTRMFRENTVQQSSKYEAVILAPQFSQDPLEVKLVWIQSLQNGLPTLSTCYQMVVKQEVQWFDACVDASSGEVVSIVDWVNDAEFDVYTYPGIDPVKGDRQKEVDPSEATPSPLQWNTQSKNGEETLFTDTIGNNAYCQDNPSGGSGWENNYRPDGGNSLLFNFPIDFNQQPSVYKDAAITNLFYWNNLIHDLFYRVGFDEPSGNFQEFNFDRGGKENDAVQANAQDGAGYNNANFATPVDGRRPRMRMYLWNRFNPMRDGDLDSGIIIHEYAHGISNRLTGGPDRVDCLRNMEGGGMGEGWGDAFAVLLEQKASNVPTQAFGMGVYVTNVNGIRPYPYCTVMSVNPQTYAFLNRNDYRGRVHSIGSVWATMINEVYWEVLKITGLDPDWYNGDGGNNHLLRNLIDGMKLQPCNPNFVQARDAIMQADETNYGGKYTCNMWTAFAKRGLGTGAKGGLTGSNDVVESFETPSHC